MDLLLQITINILLMHIEKEMLYGHRNLFLNKNLTRKETEKKRDVFILVKRRTNIHTLGGLPFVLLKKT
jgi:hypothetical protein